MPSLSVVKAANASFSPSYLPVLVVTGATSGIGQALTEAFARYTQGRAHIIFIGRNETAAKSIIASLPTHTSSKYEFIHCDLTLMKNVHALAKDIAARVPKVNFLVHSAGVFGFRGRIDTDEGIDVKLASRYYARWALTNDLLPLLRKAADQGEPASVLSVLGAGAALDTEVDLDDLGLHKNYSGFKAIKASIKYNDLMVAEFAEREADIAFTHIFPGNVNTGVYKSHKLIFKFFIFLLTPLIWLFTKTQETCAEYMLFSLLDAQKGMYRRNETGDDIGVKKFPVTKDAQKLLWEHTLQVVGSPDLI